MGSLSNCEREPLTADAMMIFKQALSQKWIFMISSCGPVSGSLIKALLYALIPVSQSKSLHSDRQHGTVIGCILKVIGQNVYE